MRRQCWLVFAFFLCVYTLTMSGHIYSWDTDTKLRVTESIVRDHDIVLENEFNPGEPYYSYFPIGQSIAFIPLYLLGSTVSKIASIPRELTIEFFVSLYNVLIVALICATMFLVLMKLGYKGRTSFLTTLVLGFTTLMWPYSKMGWAEPTCGLLLLVAILLFSMFLKDKRLKWIIPMGLCIGAATLFRLEALILGLPFLVLIVLRGENHRQSVLWGVVFVISLMSLFSGNLLYNYLRFGNPLDFGVYSQVSGQLVRSPLLSRVLKGLFFYSVSCNKSVLVFSPPVLLFFFSIGRFHRSYRPVALLIMLTAATHFLFFAVLGRSSWTWGPRYLVPIIPLLIIPVASLIETGRFRRLVGITCGVGIMIQMLVVSVSHTVVLEKVLRDKGEKVLWQGWSEVFPPISNIHLVLAAHEAGSYFRNMHKMKDQPMNASDLQEKECRNTVRINTFDFWFLLAYFAGVPLKVIVLALGALILLLLRTILRIKRTILMC